MYYDSYEHREYRNTTTWVLILLALGGVLARWALSSFSWGTSDVDFWWRGAEEVRRFGLVELYRRDPSFTVPPLPALLAYSASNLSEQLGASFPMFMRLPGLLAELASIVLIFLFLRSAGLRQAAVGCSIYSLSLLAVLVAGYHGSYQPVSAFLALASLLLLELRGRSLLAGLALGLACNFEWLPILLVPALLSGSRTLREALSSVAGIAVGLVPFFLPAFWLGFPYLRQMLYLPSGQDGWGLLAGLQLLVAYLPQLKEHLSLLLNQSSYILDSLVLLGVLYLSAKELLVPRRTPLHVAALSVGIFTILSPRLSLEQFLLPSLFFSATLPKAAIPFNTLAGIAALVLYLHFNVSLTPLRSSHDGISPLLYNVLALLAWAGAGYALLRLWRTETLNEPPRRPLFDEDDTF